MNATRLRKAFRYPGDDDGLDDAPAEGIDEQEQETLIAQIATEDAQSIAFYRVFFLALPALGLVYFALLLAVVPPPSGAQAGAHPFFYTLSAASLLLSLYAAYLIEIPSSSSSSSTSTSASATNDTTRLIRAWLNPINAAVCGTASILALTATPPSSHHGIPISFSALPVVGIFLIVAVARRELRPVNVRELERMRYTYKGA